VVENLGIVSILVAAVLAAVAMFMRKRSEPVKGPAAPPTPVMVEEVREEIEKSAQENLDAISVGLTGADPAGAVADAANRLARLRK
tara:strand:+ start:3094 stop:3351 length:258 start_codon:yes stop_codon:yes gene_type:complete